MDERIIEAISSHITDHFGPIDEVLHELIPQAVHVDVHVVKPSVKRPFFTLVTSGMSEEPMATPPGSEGQVTPYVELMLALPKDWRMDKLDEPRWGWPVHWLRFLARYPHDFETWLYVSHTIPNGEDSEPFAPGTEQCCWFVRIPQTAPEAACEMKYKDRTILFLGLTAIYKSEMEFALSDDVNSLYALDQALTAAGVTELIDLTRPQLTQEQMSAHLGKQP